MIFKYQYFRCIPFDDATKTQNGGVIGAGASIGNQSDNAVVSASIGAAGAFIGRGKLQR